MPFVLVIVGILMVVTGAKGTYAQFGSQVASDFTGPGNFTTWVVALGAVGSIGYIDALRAFSRLFMALILIAMVLSNKGFFAKFTDALKTGPVAPEAIAGTEARPTFGTSSDPTQIKANKYFDFFSNLFGGGSSATTGAQ